MFTLSTIPGFFSIYTYVSRNVSGENLESNFSLSKSNNKVNIFTVKQMTKMLFNDIDDFLN